MWMSRCRLKKHCARSHIILWATPTKTATSKKKRPKCEYIRDRCETLPLRASKIESGMKRKAKVNLGRDSLEKSKLYYQIVYELEKNLVYSCWNVAFADTWWEKQNLKSEHVKWWNIVLAVKIPTFLVFLSCPLWSKLMHTCHSCLHVKYDALFQTGGYFSATWKIHGLWSLVQYSRTWL